MAEECEVTAAGAAAMARPWAALGAGFLLGAAVCGVTAALVLRRAQRRQGAASLAFSDSEDEDGADSDDEAAEEFKMVLVVNMELKMGKGKMAAQCCHACLGAFRRAPADMVRPWARAGQPKIALKCPDLQQMLKVAEQAKAMGLPHYVVADAGRTQIAAGSRTVCAVGPAPVSAINKITGDLKLL